ncbi:MAG: preprotein translocase subunit SecF [Candidatus Aenigmarchaeota archaeon]|nr:preprotein translocase subunit SecF [Candidatus Aenigmarchaeota archaeon]
MSETEKSYKKYLIILPAALLVFSIIYVIVVPLNLDIDFKGGSQITGKFGSISVTELEAKLSQFSAIVMETSSATGKTYIIDLPPEAETEKVVAYMKSNGIEVSEINMQTIGPALGSSFLKQAQFALIAAFIAMSLVVFIMFRAFMPSLYVVLAGFADIVEALAFSQILGIKLSLATFAALLLLLGYSVDTDILLTSRVLKGEGVLQEKIRGAFRTGITMTGTAFAVLVAMFFLSGSVILGQIAAVLLIGLLFDVINTWITNSELLEVYVKRRYGV